jgi:hypothetical protein
LAAIKGLAVLTILTTFDAPSIHSKVVTRAYKSASSKQTNGQTISTFRAFKVIIILALLSGRIAIKA